VVSTAVDLALVASGEIEIVHVERAWARISPELQAYDTLAAIRARYGVTAPAATTAAANRPDIVDTPGSVIADARASYADAPGDQVVNLGAVGTTVRCNDTRWNSDPAFYLGEADRMAKKYSFFGYMNGVPLCAFWPCEPQDSKLGSLRTHQDTARATRWVAINDEGMHGRTSAARRGVPRRSGTGSCSAVSCRAKDQVCGTSPLPAELSVYPVDGPGGRERRPPAAEQGRDPVGPAEPGAAAGAGHGREQLGRLSEREPSDKREQRAPARPPGCAAVVSVTNDLPSAFPLLDPIGSDDVPGRVASVVPSH
jgi:hypothetical protein